MYIQYVYILAALILLWYFAVHKFDILIEYLFQLCILIETNVYGGTPNSSKS